MQFEIVVRIEPPCTANFPCAKVFLRAWEKRLFIARSEQYNSGAAREIVGAVIVAVGARKPKLGAVREAGWPCGLAAHKFADRNCWVEVKVE